MDETWWPTVFSVMTERAAISAFVKPSARSSRTSSSRRVSPRGARAWPRGGRGRRRGHRARGADARRTRQPAERRARAVARGCAAVRPRRRSGERHGRVVRAAERLPRRRSACGGRRPARVANCSGTLPTFSGGPPIRFRQSGQLAGDPTVDDRDDWDGPGFLERPLRFAGEERGLGSRTRATGYALLPAVAVEEAQSPRPSRPAPRGRRDVRAAWRAREAARNG